MIVRTGILLLLAGLAWSTPWSGRIAGVRSETLDVGVIGFVEPAAREEAGDITPRVTLHNYGTSRADLIVTVSIRTSDSIHYASTVSISSGLPPGQDSLVQFEAWSALPGSFAVRCSARLAGDSNPANDTFSFAFLVVPAVVTGWLAGPDITGTSGKRVKDGGALAYAEMQNAECGLRNAEDGGLFAFKGGNTCEFLYYDVELDTWTSLAAIPDTNSAGRRKRVKKGAALAGVGGRIYALKGNSTYEFWRFNSADTSSQPHSWTQLADVPAGTKSLKEGAGLAGLTIGDTDYVYLLKGSNTFEFHRYNVARNAWETRASAPEGRSRRAFKTGSGLSYDGDQTLYALKGTQNELFAYGLDSDRWVTRANLPLLGRSGKKKKAKDGASIAFAPSPLHPSPNGRGEGGEGCVFALKGGNTREFWRYDPDTDAWTQLEDVPLGRGKRVKGGGALVAAGSSLFALKGNNTLEFYRYAPAIETARVSENRRGPLATHLATNSGEICYFLPRAGTVRLGLHSTTGRLIRTLNVGPQAAGLNRVPLTAFGDRLPRSVYLLRIKTESSALTHKLVLQ